MQAILKKIKNKPLSTAIFIFFVIIPQAVYLYYSLKPLSFFGKHVKPLFQTLSGREDSKPLLPLYKRCSERVEEETQ